MRGAWRIRRLYRRLASVLQIIACKYPYRVQCNICAWKGRRLISDSWHPYTVCPKCKSEVRHRLLFAAINTIPVLSVRNIIQDKRILHFAPEPFLSTFFANTATTYITADLYRNDVDMNLDISKMTDIKSESLDLVIACDILEHIPDDSAALREIHRVLALGGWAILTVPQQDNLASTLTDDTATTPAERKAAFGEESHLRFYGQDFPDLLQKHRFTVTITDERQLDPKTVSTHVLFPPIISKNPLATNHRKVFFGQKL